MTDPYTIAKEDEALTHWCERCNAHIPSGEIKDDGLCHGCAKKEQNGEEATNG